MCIDANGVQTFIKADKRTLIQQFDLAIPIRDMRLLDSAAATSQRGNIAVREGAIVFSIECASSSKCSLYAKQSLTLAPRYPTIPETCRSEQMCWSKP